MKLDKGSLAVILTVLILALCVALPRAFVPRDKTVASETAAPAETTASGNAAALDETSLSRAQKITLFGQWLPKDDSQKQLELTDVYALSTASIVACEDAASAVCERICPDQSENTYLSSNGENLYVTSNGTGRMRIMQIYAEWTGDWKNWFIVYLDADTRDVMYAYYSGQCLHDVQSYISGTEISLVSTAQELAAAFGMSYNGLSYSENGDWNTIAHMYREDDAYDYGIYRYVYEDAGPSLLVDLKFSMVG